MVSRLLLGLFAGLCLLELSEGARFSNCLGDRKYVEGYDDPYRSCFVNSTSTVRWTVVTETGVTLHLGTCYGSDNCTTPYSSSDLEFTHYGSNISVQFYNIASQFSGVLTCQETLKNGTVLTDTCPLNVVRIVRHVRHVDFRENSTRNIYCYNSPYTPSSVRWSLTTTSGQTLDLGTCTGVNSCTSPHAPAITVQRPYNYRSRVHFLMVDRSKGGDVFCSFTYSGLNETDNATFNVNSPATVSNCHAEVHPGNWSTILSCDVSNVFSSAGHYNFTVYKHVKVLRNGKLIGANSYLFDGRLSYRDVLTPYTNSTDNKLYYRGRLTYSWPLSPVQGIYTNLRVFVYSGFFASTDSYVGYTVNITTPSQPTHNCSELNYIPETGVVPCVCTADYLGSPAGRLVWLLGNVTIATGDYGLTQLTFPSGHVSRQHDGMKVTCQLDWVQPINTAFTLHLRQGARISNCQGDRKYVEGSESPYLDCYVNSTSTVRWTVVNETGATLHLGTCYWHGNCTTPYSSSDLSFTHYGSYINAQFHKISSEFSGEVTCQETLTDGTVLTDTCPLNVARKQEESTSISTVLIGVIIGGVVAFLLVVTIVVHVVIVYRRLQRPDSSRRERQEGVHDHRTLTPAGHYPAPDHNGVELGGLNLDLTNPSLDEQNERPLSDYDVISDENPAIAENLAESSLPAEQPDYISLREDPADYLTPCSPHESSEDQNDSNYLTLYPPRPNGDGQEREDQTYLTPCSPHESREDKNDSDYLTPCSPHESREDKNDSDYLMPCSPHESREDKNDSDYLTPCSSHEGGEDRNDSDYLTPSLAL